MLSVLLKHTFLLGSVVIGLYAGLLGLLTTSAVQAHAVYLHKIQMTWFKDLDVPESFGFLCNQVSPFSIESDAGDKLYAWHVLPLGLYHKHESELTADSPGFTQDITTRHAFKLLRDDPNAILVIHMHGAAGTVGLGHRVPNYRALSAADPSSIHVLTFDYRGFGRSSGSPSESVMIHDAIAVIQWATKVAGIPPSRIIIFGQSIGTAVALAISEHFALQSPPVTFAGTILVAPFVDVATLVSTYRIAGTIPIMSPIARFPPLLNHLKSYIRDKWSSQDRLAKCVKSNEAKGVKYQLTFIHAEDDWDIPWHHTLALVQHAIDAAHLIRPANDTVKKILSGKNVNLGAAGTIREWKTENGITMEQDLKYGLHDVVMGNPVVSLAVMSMLDNGKYIQ